MQITCNTLSAYQVQHVVLRSTWYKGTAQLLSLTEFKLHLFELFILLAEPLTGEDLCKLKQTAAKFKQLAILR